MKTALLFAVALGAAGLVWFASTFLGDTINVLVDTPPTATSAVASVAIFQEPTEILEEKESTLTQPVPTSTPKATEKVPPRSSKIAIDQKAAFGNTTSTSVASRIITPYESSPLSLETIDSVTRAATVNILCMPNGGSLRPTSGSGVIIDPRGIILTDAHVAQYVLLSDAANIDLSCDIRTGSPAIPHWKAKVLYIPPAWVDEHVGEIRMDHPTGTGEHDYALLFITSDIAGIVPSVPFPYLPVDTRENIAFQDDRVFVAGYPAEFAGGIAAQRGLYASTAIAKIQKLLTFGSGSVDVFSVGGIIAAQGGSSGGPVVNPWGYVVGIVTTTSEGKTTADRDLHANAVSYINKDIAAQSGSNLSQILEKDPLTTEKTFEETVTPALIAKYLAILLR